MSINVNGADYKGNYPHLLLLKNQKRNSEIALNLQHDASLDEEIPPLLTIKGYKWLDSVWTNCFYIITPYQTSSTWRPIELEFMLLPNGTWGYRFKDTGIYLDSNNPIISLAEHEMIYNILKYLSNKYQSKVDALVKAQERLTGGEISE